MNTFSSQQQRRNTFWLIALTSKSWLIILGNMLLTCLLLDCWEFWRNNEILLNWKMCSVYTTFISGNKEVFGKVIKWERISQSHERRQVLDYNDNISENQFEHCVSVMIFWPHNKEALQSMVHINAMHSAWLDTHQLPHNVTIRGWMSIYNDDLAENLNIHVSYSFVNNYKELLLESDIW